MSSDESVLDVCVTCTLYKTSKEGRMDKRKALKTTK